MANHRVLCSNCMKNFCTSCKREPYHVGMTCDEATNHQNASKCRFCTKEIKRVYKTSEKAFKECCGGSECVAMIKQTCNKIHACGHVCCGFRDETQCLPCLEADCVTAYNAKQPTKQTMVLEGQNTDEYCSICWSQCLGQEPCVLLTCRHIFHLNCIMKILKFRWLSPRIVFQFSNCPSCKSIKIDAPYCP